MNEIEIIEIKSEGLKDLQQISIQTFEETFTEHNTAEDMQEYLKTSFSDAKLLSELNDKDSHFFLAKSKNRVIGYLKLNLGASQTDLKDQNAIEIERIYVLKEFLGKKVGQQLFEFAIHIASEKKMQYIWLGVWEENHRALRFYQKNGFEAFDKHFFKLGNDVQTDIMMKKKLN